MNPHIPAKQRVVRVGDVLVDGPDSIRPPREIDNYGWLECELRLIQVAGGAMTSVAVYSDDTMNRKDEFLEPLLRRVHWERADDIRRALAGEISWPTATVTLSHFGAARGDVDLLMRDIQGRLSAAPFIATGLVVDRSVPPVAPDSRGEIRVFARNGVQRVEVATWAAEDGGLHSAAADAIAFLSQLMQPIRLDGWRETYRHRFDSDTLGGLYHWDYGPPRDSSPAA